MFSERWSLSYRFIEISVIKFYIKIFPPQTTHLIQNWRKKLGMTPSHVLLRRKQKEEISKAIRFREENFSKWKRKKTTPVILSQFTMNFQF